MRQRLARTMWAAGSKRRLARANDRTLQKVLSVKTTGVVPGRFRRQLDRRSELRTLCAGAARPGASGGLRRGG